MIKGGRAGGNALIEFREDGTWVPGSNPGGPLPLIK